jgi:hypothetical protein
VYGGKTVVYRILAKNPEGKKSLERPRRRWKDNMQIDLEIGRESVECINLAQDRNKLWALLNVYNVPDLEFKSRNKRIARCYGNPVPLRIRQDSSNQIELNSVITSGK